MQAKRLISAILITVLLFSLAAPAYALQGNEATAEEVAEAMRAVSNSLYELGDTASSGETEAIADIFTSFVKTAATMAPILTTINGSVTFLRLIGVMTDPTQAKLSGILSQLRTIDERLSSMDDKLNDLTTAMSELKASVEFNARTEKAILYEASWRDFAYRYMENGMDKLVTQYNSMLRTGLMSWCSGARNENSVDNSRIILLYKNGSKGYELSLSDQNGVPSDFTAEDRWIVLPAECLPDTFSYDVNTFNEALAGDIAARISEAVSGGNLGIFETQNYPLLTEEGVADITDADIAALASDAVNTLVYRVASAKVNADPTFAGEVSRQFENYCSHLKASGDGLDATLKTFYLTHAFEYSVADDIRDFCDRMIILTGTYGTFAANVLGMSHLTTDEEKVAAVTQMTSAIEMAEQAKTNGITGNGNYCYITGTFLEYTTVSFDARAEINAHYTMSNTRYESFKASGPTVNILNKLLFDPVPAGDSAMIVIVNTLLANGVTPDHKYLSEHIGRGTIEDYGKIVTGYSPVQTLSFDGNTKLHVRKTFGSYFDDNSTITELPDDDADMEDVVYRRKISGSLYDLSSGKLTSNTTLCAEAVYGENHALWVTDEGALMGGPADYSAFYDSYSVEETGIDTTGKFRRHSYSMSTEYNILISGPKSVKLKSGNEYDPLYSLEEDVPPCEYDASVYDEAGESVIVSGEEHPLLGGAGAPATEVYGEAKPDVAFIVIVIAAGAIIAAGVVLLVVKKKKKK